MVSLAWPDPHLATRDWSAKLPKKEEKDNQYLHGAHGCDARQRLRFYSCYRKLWLSHDTIKLLQLWGWGCPAAGTRGSGSAVKEEVQLIHAGVIYLGIISRINLHILIAKFYHILYTLYKIELITEWYPSSQADRKIHHVRHVIIIHILQYRSPDCRKIKKSVSVHHYNHVEH